MCLFFIRFINVAQRRFDQIMSEHESITEALTQIFKENEIAEKLFSQLEHEKIVLDERIAVSKTI